MTVGFARGCRRRTIAGYTVTQRLDVFYPLCRVLDLEETGTTEFQFRHILCRCPWWKALGGRPLVKRPW